MSRLSELKDREVTTKARVVWIVTGLAALVVVVWSLFGVVDWWLIGLSAAFLIELWIIYRIHFPVGDDSKAAGLGDKRLVLAALQAVFPQAPRQEADRTPLILEGFTHAIAGGAETLVCKLPVGMTVEKLAGNGNRATFLSALDLDVDHERIVLSKDRGRENWLRVTIKAPVVPLAPRYPAAAAGCWSDPVLLGRDMAGGDVYAPTWQKGSWLIAGKTDSGKTVACRLLVRHYAADPDAVLWGADGKGDDAADWGGIRPRFARWVDTLNDNGGAQYLAMLTDLQLEVDDRYRRKNAGEKLPGMLVFLDEASHLRNRLSDKDKTVHDETLRQVVSTCRAASVLVAMVIQRPDASQWPSGVRSQASVTVCMRVRPTDAPLVFGEPIDGDHDIGHFPKGQGLLDDGHGVVRFLADWMTDPLMAEFCGPFQKPQDAPVLTLVPDLPQDAPVTLWGECRRLVTGEMSMKALWAALGDAGHPLEFRGGSAAVLSRRLGKMGVEGDRSAGGGAMLRPEMFADASPDASPDASDAIIGATR